MPLQIIHHDITKLSVDAIVNAANTTLLGGGGVDGCIHRAAGKSLLAECKTLGGCETGNAKITKGYKLPCKYVIHTVGPRYRDGIHREKELLESCYRTSLEIAADYDCETVAFPLISAGVYGYPKDEALQIAITTIKEFLLNCDITVYLVIFDKNDYRPDAKLLSAIQSFLDSNCFEIKSADSALFECCKSIPSPCASYSALEDFLSEVDESFTEMLLRKIDESGMTDAECYKHANIDRKLFSKIRSDKHYRPSKHTAIAFAIALHLSLWTTPENFLKKPVFLSHTAITLT